MKRCSKCTLMKHPVDFYRNQRRRLASRCKSCVLRADADKRVQLRELSDELKAATP